MRKFTSHEYVDRYCNDRLNILSDRNMNRRIFLGFWLALFGVIAWFDRRSWTRKPMSAIDKGQKPEKFRINHDAFHAKYTGRTAHGIQYFMTSGFDQGGNPVRAGGIRRDFVML